YPLIINMKQSSEKPLKEKVLDVEEITPGMMASHSIVTLSGMLIAKGDTELDAAMIKRIKQLAASGMIEEKITVLIPE
ncbi:MAG: hypothetical protein QG635_2234, partial [Bacteroidota bacterium]|nr:hypothetical protein [Bacteroidota bacterium]